MGDTTKFPDCFEDFRQLAKDQFLSKYERIGFPDSYRAGLEKRIFADIQEKCTNLKAVNKNVLDIGPGCSDLPMLMIEHCKKQKHHLTLIDNEEMLGLLPENDFIKKLAALYPNCPDFIAKHQQVFDVIVCYSVLQYVLIDTAFFRFIDLTLSLLAPEGQLLLGDIPNVSKRKRFFASETGIRFHQKFMNTGEIPEVTFNQIEYDKIDDAIVIAILQRARLQGFNAYVLPQNSDLPMSNRREDILIQRP